MPLSQLFGALFDNDTIWILIPLTALLIPIIAILISHQQKMAQIIHGKSYDPNLENEVRALRQEVQQLRQMLSGQAPYDLPNSPVIVPPPSEPFGIRQEVRFSDR